MDELIKTSFLFLEQISTPLIAVVVALFGYRIHERMRLQHYLGELRAWASACQDCLSEATHLCDLDPSVTSDPNFFNRRHEVLVRLSSYIDQGRWFFPDVKPMGAEHWQLDTYRSLKQRPLDDLVYAYGAVKKMSYSNRQENTFLRTPLVEIKKDFTLSVRTILDPKKAQKQFGIVMKKKRPDS